MPLLAEQKCERRAFSVLRLNTRNDDAAPFPPSCVKNANAVRDKTLSALFSTFLFFFFIFSMNEYDYTAVYASSARNRTTTCNTTITSPFYTSRL